MWQLLHSPESHHSSSESDHQDPSALAAQLSYTPDNPFHVAYMKQCIADKGYHDHTNVTNKHANECLRAFAKDRDAHVTAFAAAAGMDNSYKQSMAREEKTLDSVDKLKGSAFCEKVRLCNSNL